MAVRNSKLNRWLVFIICIAALLSCNNKEPVKKIYKEKDTIVTTFMNKSIIKSRGENYIFFKTHQKEKTNQYIFNVEGDRFIFSRDSIQYTPDILNLQGKVGDISYKADLENHLNSLVKEMERLGIRDVSSESASAGLDLKFFLKKKGVIIFVSNPEKVSGPRFKDYINSMQKLDDNWYYTFNE